MNQMFRTAQGFIFDCDGTLLDSMGIWNDLEERMFAQAPVPPTVEQMNEIRAAPIEEGAVLFHKLGVGEGPEHVLRMLDAALLGFYQSEALPKPGAVEFVHRAHKAGIPCTVVTSSPARYVEAGLARAGILECFMRVITTDNVGISKADPRIYELACECMGSCIERTWAFDDALYAIRVMAGCGLQTIACYDCDETGRFEDLEAIANMTIRSFEELL